eukprot:10642614-Karenia_brevis.AAC.1
MDQVAAARATLSAREGRLLGGGAKMQIGTKRKRDESGEQELDMGQSTELGNAIFKAVDALRKDDRLLRYCPVDCDFDIIKTWRQNRISHAQ